MGIALFSGAQLRDWRVKVLKGEWSEEKIERIKNIIIGLIEQYQPDVLAIKKLRPTRSSASLDSLVDELKIIAVSQNLPVYEYPMTYVGAFMSPGKKIDKWKLAELMATRYRELLSEWEKERQRMENAEREKKPGKKFYSKKSYYMRMFEAVFVAYVCFRQLDRGATEPFMDTPAAG